MRSIEQGLDKLNRCPILLSYVPLLNNLSQIPFQQELIYNQWINDVISTQETTLISWNCCQRLQQKSKEVKRSSIDLLDKVGVVFLHFG